MKLPIYWGNWFYMDWGYTGYSLFVIRLWNVYFKIKAADKPMLFSERERIRCRVFTIGKWWLIIGVQ